MAVLASRTIFEDRGQRFGGVQIVVQGFVELLAGRLGALRDLLVRAFGKLVGFQAQLEIAQPLDGGRGRLSVRRR